MNRFGAGQTALVVPVPAAEPAVGSIRKAHDPAAAYGAPTHVSVLFPYVAVDDVDATVLSDLRQVCRAVPTFEVELARVGRFPGVLWLDPRPARPFRVLSEAVVARWPAYPPYGGAFEEVVPAGTRSRSAEPLCA